jgi:excisionase family DNA binding protein
MPRLAYSVSEAAKVVGVGKTKLLEMMRCGDGPRSFKLGRRRLIEHDVLSEWLSMCGDRWGQDSLHVEDDVV